jgi:hypothetical protein
MEPYGRNAVSDSVRAIWCVIALEEQTRILKEVQRGKPVRSIGTTDCF